jgi:hypothetical protein
MISLNKETPAHDTQPQRHIDARQEAWVDDEQSSNGRRDKIA